jgi:hypothetical protein
MSKSAEGDAQAVARELLRYLRAHPEAADTLDGAARWWLDRPPAMAVMERAMSMLEDEQFVQRHVLPGGAAVFRGGRRLGTADRTH